MPRRVLIFLLVAAILLIPAFSAWSDGDGYVIVSGTLADWAIATTGGVLPYSMIGGTLYATQQDAQAAIASMTGTSLDTYYVWVCVSDACAPVDPYNVGN